ncbi:MAG: nucleotidyltransferase family protein [Chloroflexota bacterium]
MELDELSELLKDHRSELIQHGVESLAVFGSLARGEGSQDSDIDLLVDFNRPVGLFEFTRLKHYLEKLTGQRVDLVTRDALRPAMREVILSEALCII